MNRLMANLYNKPGLGTRLRVLQRLVHTLSMGKVTKAAKPLPNDHAVKPDNDEVDPSKIINDLADY